MKQPFSPRQARDNREMRNWLHDQVASFAKDKSTLIFDLSGDLQKDTSESNANVAPIESEIWDLIYNTCKKGDFDEIQSLRRMFSLSTSLCKIIGFCPPDRLEALKAKSYMSFAIPKEEQLTIIASFKNNTNVTNNTPTAELLKFWSTYYAIIQEDLPNVGCLELGLLPEMVDILKHTPYIKAIEVLPHHDVKLQLRCSEKIVANIVACDEKELQGLKDLKGLQIISGANLDYDVIIKKFKQCHKHGFAIEKII